MRGRWIALSLPRRIIADHCHFARKTPLGVLRRNLDLGPLAAARAALPERPPWSALVLKGFALVAAEEPQFRRTYAKLPWPHLYEYPGSVGGIVVERDYHGEEALFIARIKHPDAHSLADIAGVLERAKNGPVESNKNFRVALAIARLPQLLRRAIWWLGLNIGRQRPNFFPTYLISVLGRGGTEVVFPVMPFTLFLSFGRIDETGQTCLTCAFDHRTMDGAVVARGMERLEAVLNTALVEGLGQA